jgi:hypothetical protein
VSDRNVRAVRELDDLGDLLRRGGEDDGLRDELLPPVLREGRRHPGAVEERRAAGEDVILAADGDELVDQGVGKRCDRHLMLLPVMLARS